MRMIDRGEREPRLGNRGAGAAEILGIRELGVSRLVGRGLLPMHIWGEKYGLDRADVEHLALERQAHQDHP